jgi:hypothetical protein
MGLEIGEKKKGSEMTKPSKCQNCFKPHDFSKEAFGWCKTCNKADMCWQCTEEHEYLPGKSRRIIVITNPAWIRNMVKNMGYE